MAGRVLMIQGTTSHAGKSSLVAGLCRVFSRRGLSVAPFKSQNMALNSAVTPDGAEIGRAQAFQALGARVEPHADMNPVLLKPCSPTGSQVVVLGKPVGVMQVREYHAYQAQLWPVITDALARLRDNYDLVLIEGAGSPAEINLRHHDIANMAVALHAKAPVIIVVDIDRGGAFAHLVGTMELLAPEERELVSGFIINKFRGDASLLDSGIAMLEARYDVPVLGVLPYLTGWRGDEEDSLGIETIASTAEDIDGEDIGGTKLILAVIKLPYISNFTDIAALGVEPDVVIRWVCTPTDLLGVDGIVIPGSKSTVDDLAWLRATGVAESIGKAALDGVPVVGICGGYQMLGHRIEDPLGIEGGNADGLGLLDITTVFHPQKRTERVSGTLTGAALAPAGTAVRGYEIHMGRTTRGPSVQPLARIESADGRVYYDGAVSSELPICGTYLHGLFDEAALRRAWLNHLRDRRGFEPILHHETPAHSQDPLDYFADMLEKHLDISAVLNMTESREALR